MADHCSEMMQEGAADQLSKDTHNKASAEGDCCTDVCQCSLGVCSSPLLNNSILLTSFEWSSHPQFLDSNASIVRIAASLYRPPITA